MQIIFSDYHVRHDTKLRLPGLPFPCHEISARAEAIRVAVTSAQIGELSEPQDFGLVPIQTVHSPEFVVQTAFQNSRAFIEGPNPVVADTTAGEDGGTSRMDFQVG